MDIIQFLVDELNSITEPTEEDVIIELPFTQVLDDCFHLVKQKYDIDLNTHDLIFKLNQEDNWFDVPNEIYLACGDFCTNVDIIQVWHEVGHYVQHSIKDLDKTSPKYWELIPTLFEELCIEFYKLKFENYRTRQLRQFIAVALIDQELIINGRENFLRIIEHIQNFCHVNVTLSMLGHLEPGSRYVGNYYGYVLCRKIVKQLNTNDQKISLIKETIMKKDADEMKGKKGKGGKGKKPC